MYHNGPLAYSVLILFLSPYPATSFQFLPFSYLPLQDFHTFIALIFLYTECLCFYRIIFLCHFLATASLFDLSTFHSFSFICFPPPIVDCLMALKQYFVTHKSCFVVWCTSLTMFEENNVIRNIVIES